MATDRAANPKSSTTSRFRRLNPWYNLRQLMQYRAAINREVVQAMALHPGTFTTCLRKSSSAGPDCLASQSLVWTSKYATVPHHVKQGCRTKGGALFDHAGLYIGFVQQRRATMTDG
jgi:hypothetical protein